jgi:hypothetical protein
MKARIKATGEIISLDEKSTVLDANPCNFNGYEISELEILYENTNFPKDYWQKLEHTYAGMAMQGLMSYIKQITPENGCSYCDTIVDFSVKVAHALVEKLKKESK